ncbi:MAG: hypothetical protein U1F83_18945 [Verrucomicrobiota bacterium]
MKTLEMIGEIAEAALPLTMLCCGLILGIDLAEWLVARASKKKDQKPGNDNQENGRK